MRENPLYAVTTVAGAPVFPGDVITDGDGDPAVLVSVTRGPEDRDGAQIMYSRDPNNGHRAVVNTWVFGLRVDLYCPSCGTPVPLSACDCCVPGNCAGTCRDCGWVHPLLLGYED